MGESEFTVRSRQKFKKLFEFREEGKHCDVVFMGNNGHEFHCHKIILSLVTDVFDASYKFKTEDEGITRIKLKDWEIKDDTFRIILDIIYMGRPMVIFDDAVDLMFDADKLLMDDVVKFIVDQIVARDDLKGKGPHSLVRLCTFPGLSKCQKLLSYIKRRMEHNFLIVSRSRDFYKISLQDLLYLDVLKKADNFESPETCINFIGKWIMYDVEKRMTKIETIAKYLNLNAGPKIEKFLSAFNDVRKNNGNPDTVVCILRIGLSGLLFESVRQNFESWIAQNKKNELTSTFEDERSRALSSPQKERKINYPQYAEWFECHDAHNA